MRFPFTVLSDADTDVVGFGTNAVDYLIQVPAYPDFNSKVELLKYTQAPGGEVASAMAGLSRLGLKTIYAGRFGDDAAGEFGLRSLKEDGVNVSYAEQVADARTQIAFIVIDARTGERTVMWQRDEKLSYSEVEAPIEAVSRGRVLHLTPHDTRACIALALEANRLGVVVSTDIDNIFDGADELLPLIDILIVSEDFPRRMFGRLESLAALNELRRLYGCAVIGMTKGERGSTLLVNDTVIESRGKKVPGGCVDTTGAGDAFRVGFLFGLLTGESVETSAEMANAVAALKCRELGARAALPRRSELLAFLKMI
jgi:sugar/nucleoside kinase (ribokinase family)